MKIHTKTKPILLAISNCGFITEHIAKKHFNTTASDLKYMVEVGLIEKSMPYIVYTKATIIFTLTDKGKDLIRTYGYDIYKSDITQLEHDYLLLKVYSCLENEVQEKWQNETELKRIYKQTTCDAIFQVNDKLIGVEITTPRYTKLKINESMKFISEFCDDSIVIKTSDIKI
ncbi:MAG: hypothetical protein ACRDA5_16000 [Clostridium sp.]